MIQCPVCGATYGVTHSCAGAMASKSVPSATFRTPAGFAPAYYIRQAWAIARLDDAAIIAASQDQNALLYGLGIWVTGQFLLFTGLIARALNSRTTINWFAACVGIFILILIDAVFMLLHYGLCHFLARQWFGARGTYLGILRAMLLGSIVGWLMVIPYVGILVAALWSIAVLMIVFEDVDGIQRIQAFGLSFGVGIVFFALSNMLFAPKP